MAYNTKNILRSGDASPIPIPQFYNPTEDAFNPLTGANLGSGRYGADGVMWGKTAGGVYIPVQVNANGEVLTQLSGRKLAVNTNNYNQTLNVAGSGGNTEIAITPPVGEFWRIKDILIVIPAPVGATVQYHTLEVGYCSAFVGALWAKYVYNKEIKLSYNMLYGTVEIATPSAESEQRRQLLNIVATNTNPLKIVYRNYTDVAQTGTAMIKVTREVEYIV